MEKKIKVAFVINGFNIGGAERLYLDLFRHIDQSLYDVHLLTLFEFKDRPDFYAEIPPNVSVRRFNFGSFADLREWWRLTFFLYQLKPEVVLSSLFFSNTVTRLLGIFLSYKSIIVEQNTYINKTKFQILVDRLLSHLAYRIVAVSKTVLDFTANQENIAKEKFVLIHNAIDLKHIENEIKNFPGPEQYKQELGFSKEDKIVISVGRLVPQKNHLRLIEGFAEFCRERKEYKLIILGEGGMRKELENKIGELKAEKNILLLGLKKNVFPYCLSSEFFVSTSLIEGLSIAQAEALATGLPVLSTKTGGTDEMIQEGVNGYFINNDTPLEIATGLIKMTKTQFNREVVKASVLAYSIEETAKKYSALIKKCLEK
ncbi:MAG: glycosyltransferase [bacterium]|nr:glycosyltransferase [bacterium]